MNHFQGIAVVRKPERNVLQLLAMSDQESTENLYNIKHSNKASKKAGRKKEEEEDENESQLSTTCSLKQETPKKETLTSTATSG